jgi:hypothetical protein
MTSAYCRRITVLLLAGLVLGGCAEGANPVAPGAKGLAPSGRGHDLVSGLVQDGTTMTMVDEDDGIQYTLDMAARTITRQSDGLILELNAGQADSAASLFAGSVYHDPSIPGLQAIGSLSGSPTSGPCTGMDGNYCDASALRDPLLIQPILDTVKGHRGKHPLIRRATTTGGAVSYSLLAGDPCTNIINAALPKVIEYRGARTSFLKQGFRSLFQRLKDGFASIFLPWGSSDAMSFSQTMANYLTAQVAVGFLAGEWTSYGCRGDMTVVAGPYYHVGGTYSTTPTGGSYTCAQEQWQISWDGGVTWENISVKVCQFQI